MPAMERGGNKSGAATLTGTPAAATLNMRGASPQKAVPNPMIDRIRTTAAAWANAYRTVVFWGSVFVAVSRRGGSK